MTATAWAPPRTAEAPAPRVPPRPAPARRLIALDALRGAAVAAMLVMNNPGIRDAAPWPLRHSEWHGLTPADVVFPVFLFAIGASMPMSRRSREPRHMLRRVLLLTLLGLGLFIVKHGDLDAGFGVLQHIAGAYLVAWLVLRLPARWQLPAVLAGLTAIAAGFAAYGSWAPDRTLAHAVDRFIVGSWSSEGPSAMLLSSANVVGGALVGRALRRPARERGGVDVRLLLGWALISVLIGLLVATVIPVNKKIWSPSYVVLTHGIACGLLLVAHAAARGRPTRWGLRRLVELGCNPIAVYVVMTLGTYTVLPVIRHAVVPLLLGLLTAPVASTVFALGVAAAGWLLAHHLHRRRIYIRI